MKRIQTRTAAGLLLPFSSSLVFAAAIAADEPAKSQPQPPAAADSQQAGRPESSRQEQRVEVRVESRSSQSGDGDPEVKTEGRIIVIGPDGVKTEYDLNAPEGRALILQMDGGSDALKVLEGQAPKAGKKGSDAAPASERVMIGVACEEAPQLLRKHLKLDKAGLVVLSVTEKSPAAEAKIEPDDVLISLNDRQLQTIEQLMEVVSGLEGQPARLQIIRNGSPMELSVTPRRMPVPELPPVALNGDFGEGGIIRLPGFDQRLNRIFPGVIIDEQFPADQAAMERMLKKLGSLAGEELGRGSETPPATPEKQSEVQQQLQLLREELQQLRRDLQSEKKE